MESGFAGIAGERGLHEWRFSFDNSSFVLRVCRAEQRTGRRSVMDISSFPLFFGSGLGGGYQIDQTSSLPYFVGCFWGVVYARGRQDYGGESGTSDGIGIASRRRE